MSKKSVLQITTATLILGYIQPASAYYLVYAPYVEYGETEIELYMHHAQDSDATIDGTRQYVLEVGRGVTPRLFIEGKVIVDRFPNNSADAEAMSVEAVYQLTEQGEYAVDAGLLAEVEYSLDDNEVEEIEFGPLLARDFASTTLTANIIAEYEVDESKFEGRFSLQWKWRYKKNLEPALELYSSEYENIAGPVIMGKLGSGKTKFGYQVGWLTALDKSSPDNTFKVVLEYEF